MANQAQKHVTVNETSGRLDALVQAAVISPQISAEPASVYEGDAYILPASANGTSWSNFAEHDLVYFQDRAWHRIAAREGLLAYVSDEAAHLVYASGVWSGLDSNISSLDTLRGLGVGTTSDATNVFAAKLNTALWTAQYDSDGGDGDLRYTLNKQASGNSLSFVFQTHWSGRAEIGLVGNDDLTFKTSADGGTWSDLIVLKSATGSVNLPNLPTSASGLGNGDLWNDNGTLKVV
jgi:hypothetical protein